MTQQHWRLWAMGPAGLTRRCQQTRPVSPLPQPQSTPSTSPSRACLSQGRLRPPLLRPATPHRLVARRSPAQHVLASTPSAEASELMCEGTLPTAVQLSNPCQHRLALRLLRWAMLHRYVARREPSSKGLPPGLPAKVVPGCPHSV